jgi:hypothetical protein
MVIKCRWPVVLGSMVVGIGFASRGRGAELTVPSTSSVGAVSTDKLKVESDVKTHRENVRKASDDYENTISRYGRNSLEAKNAANKLDDERRQLENVLYEQGQVPGPAIPDPRNPGDPTDKLHSTLPARQIEF